jgi:BirA family transcriptional regulator, biotin operon repressor / biotin---[acetyl-CoA-carboxylase] ligase
MQFELQIFESLPSTNLYLLDLKESIHGRAILAKQQNAGFGRRGRTWVAPTGSLALSIGIEYPISNRSQLPWLPIWLAVGAHKSLCDLAPSVPLFLKWPNDFYVGQSKVGGILSQTRENAAGIRVVLGLGVNLLAAPQQMAEATSIVQCGGPDVSPQVLATLILQTLTSMSLDPIFLKREWEERAHFLGKTISFGDPNQPRETWTIANAKGLDASAGLIVELPSGEQRILLAEEVSLRL